MAYDVQKLQLLPEVRMMVPPPDELMSATRSAAADQNIQIGQNRCDDTSAVAAQVATALYPQSSVRLVCGFARDVSGWILHAWIQIGDSNYDLAWTLGGLASPEYRVAYSEEVGQTPRERIFEMLELWAVANGVVDNFEYPVALRDSAT